MGTRPCAVSAVLHAKSLGVLPPECLYGVSRNALENLPDAVRGLSTHAEGLRVSSTVPASLGPLWKRWNRAEGAEGPLQAGKAAGKAFGRRSKSSRAPLNFPFGFSPGPRCKTCGRMKAMGLNSVVSGHCAMLQTLHGLAFQSTFEAADEPGSWEF